MVGGSGLYINAVCHGLDYMPEHDEALRSELNQRYADDGIAPLQEQLKALDPDYYDEVDQNNPQRLIRAIEVNIVSGKTYAHFRQSIRKQRPFNLIKVGLNTDRKIVYRRINQRVDQMIEQGLVEEAMYLMQFREYQALNTVGYKELFDAFDEKISMEEAVELIKRNTRRFAKRQLTWFRKDEEVTWFRPGETERVLEHIKGRLDA